MWVVFLVKGTLLRMTGPISAAVDPALVVAGILLAGWLASRTGTAILESAIKGTIRRQTPEDSDQRRRLLTQITIARRVFAALVITLALIFVLFEFGMVKSLGLALLASAGVGTIVLGIAGQAVLGNLLAGVQIAITQPFRVGDSVYLEDNWGRIEDITYTYVTVRTWDQRRLLFPIRYFLNHYVENWSKTSRFLVKPIYLYVDYVADVQRIRERFFELLRAEDDWRETDDSYVALVDMRPDTMVIRCTAGAADPTSAWFMHLRLRERMVAWLQTVEDGRWLPRQRLRPLGERESQTGDERQAKDALQT